jgi:4-pyridoxate dehydrogenase
MHAESRGEVRLRSAMPQDPPSIRFNAFTADSDLETMRRGFRMGRELARRPELDPFRGEEILPAEPADSDADIDKFIRRFATPVYHPAGTCAMGSNAYSVVDTSLRVRGVEGLRVADASVMPDLVTGHINAAVMMIAEKASDMIRGRA